MSPPPPPQLFGGLLGANVFGAGATLFGWEAAGGDGLTPALAVLVVGFPLGYLIARYGPLPIARRLGRRDGITHLGAGVDRALPRVRRLVIEVDSVLTTGHQTVVDVIPIDERHKRDLRWFAGAVAHGSSDPVARAIAKLTPSHPSKVKKDSAEELTGAVDRHPVLIERDGADAVVNGGVNGHAVAGTTVRVDVDLRPMGHITVADEVRKRAARCLSTLREQGIEPILVSPSLSAPALARVADLVGESTFHAGTDAASLVSSMPDASTTGILRAVPSPEGTELRGELVLPEERGEDTVIRCSDPSIDTALAALQHVRRLRRARHIAHWVAAIAVILALPLAAGGLISLARAGLIAAGSLLLVAIVASAAALSSADPEAVAPSSGH
ncbi:cation-translocating P-type ATPase [Nocardioides sp. BGMRC 2183]|nr:cation-translocating P-type ATPase [Nocardioides sp. BGMRC 2183]